MSGHAFAKQCGIKSTPFHPPSLRSESGFKALPPKANSCDDTRSHFPESRQILSIRERAESINQELMCRLLPVLHLHHRGKCGLRRPEIRLRAISRPSALDLAISSTGRAAQSPGSGMAHGSDRFVLFSKSWKASSYARLSPRVIGCGCGALTSPSPASRRSRRKFRLSSTIPQRIENAPSYAVC